MNADAPVRVQDLRVALFVDAFPVLSETFVAEEARALLELGAAVAVEAGRLGDGGAPTPAGLAVHALDADGPWARARALLALVARHPLRAAADARACRRWRAQEWPRPLRHLAPLAARVAARGDTHLHAHFAAGAALDALRVGKLLGLPMSLTAHAHDIYAHPRNLAAKLEAAAVATSGCDYTVAELRAIAPRARVEKVVMGVDPGRFRRSGPLPQGRAVLAVGRLVEKKGFDVLVRAAALARVDRVTILGDGPERGRLEGLISELGLGGRVVLTGAAAHDGVREAIESCDLLAMPCVVAADGDRDSMPVVVKEAMAMERLIVASDEVGLPEIVLPPWGALVAPRDPAALAAAIDVLLDLDAGERARRGAAARARVLAHADVHTETRRLAELLAGGTPRVPDQTGD